MEIFFKLGGILLLKRKKLRIVELKTVTDQDDLLNKIEEFLNNI
jgi:hypothetical protein